MLRATKKIKDLNLLLHKNNFDMKLFFEYIRIMNGVNFSYIGKVLQLSPQRISDINCRRKKIKEVKFLEYLVKFDNHFNLDIEDVAAYIEEMGDLLDYGDK